MKLSRCLSAISKTSNLSGLWSLKVCRDAKAEADMEQVFRKIQRRWEGAHFQLAKFIITVWEDKAQMGNTRKKRSSIAQQSCDSGTFTIIG